MNSRAGAVMTGLVAYEVTANYLGWPTISALSRRYPALAWGLAGTWLVHVFAETAWR